MTNKNGHFIILSEITNKPYIDENRRAYSFLYRNDADSFSKENRNLIIVDLSDYSFLEICSYAYSSGAITLRVKGENSHENFALKRDELKKKYYNSDLNANLSRYLYTGNKRYIKLLKNNYFIVPVRIKNHPDASINYAIAKIENRPYVYVAFTDLDEYRKWEKLVSGWTPLEVDAAGFKRIGSKHGFIINPCGKNMIIDRKLMNIIDVEEEGEGDDR